MTTAEHLLVGPNHIRSVAAAAGVMAVTDPLFGASEEIVVCRRRPVWRVLLSPLGIAMLLMAPLTLGLTLLIAAAVHFGSMPRRIWINNGRLYSDKGIPPGGLEADDVRLQLADTKILFALRVTRYFRIHFLNEKGKERFVPVNQVHYGKREYSRAVDTLLQWLAR